MPFAWFRGRAPSAGRHALTFGLKLEALETRELPAVSLFATGADAGGGPHVEIYNSSSNLVASFYAYDSSFHGGVRVALGDVTGDGVPDIITAPGPGGVPNIRVYDSINRTLIG